MGMYEATFKIEHKSLYADISKKNNCEIEMWCNDHCDLLRIRKMPDSDINITDLSNSVGAKNVIESENEIVLVTKQCLLNHGQEDGIEKYLKRHDCLSFPPREYKNGKIRLSVISLDGDNISKFFHDINEKYSVSVESKQKISNIHTNDPLLMVEKVIPNLTERQRQALITAFDMGYYEIPRGHTTNEIAEKMGIQRRTFEEHLRRSEQKIINNIVRHFRGRG